jgi:adenosine deaminase
LLDAELRATIAAMPKIELHRHLEGSLRLDTLVDIALEHGIEMPDYNVETIRPFVQMMPGEPRTDKHFLSKFAMLRQFYRTTEIVQRITREIVEDAARDNVRYMELRFTPKALSNITELALEDVVPIVCDAGNEAAAANGIIVRYIVSMNRHEPVSLGEPVLRAAIANRERGVVGLDLAGNEAEYSCLPFRSLFQRAKSAGLGITIHAGEWAGADSVWDAIGNLGASRVGHGISVLQDPSLVQVLVDREITLEVCPSSNYLSGIVDTLEDHPLQALTRRHVLTTLNTDDPLLCNITLSDEIGVVMEHMEITLDDIKQYMLRAARAAFLPTDERENLIRQFQSYMAAVKV